LSREAKGIFPDYAMNAQFAQAKENTEKSRKGLAQESMMARPSRN
jgi:hypothetical protein